VHDQSPVGCDTTYTRLNTTIPSVRTGRPGPAPRRAPPRGAAAQEQAPRSCRPPHPTQARTHVHRRSRQHHAPHFAPLNHTSGTHHPARPPRLRPSARRGARLRSCRSRMRRCRPRSTTSPAAWRAYAPPS
jgi:hypothetical protein